MNKPSVVFRVDGGTSIGMGHVVRCLALADMLKDNFTIRFSIQQPNDTIINLIKEITPIIESLPSSNDYVSDALCFTKTLLTNDIVVLDGYHFKTDYQQEIKEKGCKLVVIDDLHSWHQMANLIINHSEGIKRSDYSAESYTKFCLGLNYILLRKPFLHNKSAIRSISSVKKVFISMGAADVNNITEKFAKALVQIKDIEEIHLMLSSINPNLEKIKKLIEENNQVKIFTHFNISAEELAELLKICDVSICPASSISLESCAIGIGLVSGFTAENQLGNLEGMEKRKTLINFGDMNLLSVEEIKSRFEEIVKSPEQLNELIKNQAKMIDGKSPERLMLAFKNLIDLKENLWFKFANETDTDLYFNWANDVEVRQNSYNQDPIIYENHVKWFLSKLKSETCLFYLFFNNENVPVGQVRIDKTANEIIIGISIDKTFRGKSLGLEMLKQSTEDYLQKFPNSVIAAYIKTENIASYRIFKKAGFGEEKIITEEGFKSYKLLKRKN